MLETVLSALIRLLSPQDLSLDGNLYAGGAVYNNGSYAARPDNSGVVLFRYGANLRLNLPKGLGIGGNVNVFTDRQRNPWLPSEVDLMPTVSWRRGDLEFQAIYEVLLPADDKGVTPGYKQQFMQVLGFYYFRLGK